MITKISGTLERIDTGSNSVELAVGPIVHEVLVPELLASSLW
jgi:superfamily II DNA or RNA helicase